ncbi:hypothetical protein ANCCEY_09257 [Ancylostoma ceylanicum]|uniref:Uncharacterized protein n=1 Tax=Ancylostoma ceylanicum TaxID=53326 RepID=A0A0D6LI33_9BILA|nr:hypothetical protein ANCCEY_09257 [Ancylostoma ceylanicum]
MDNNLSPEIIRRKRAAWAAYNTIKPAVSQMKNSKLKAELFNTTVIPALCYGSETSEMNEYPMLTESRHQAHGCSLDDVGENMV